MENAYFREYRKSIEDPSAFWGEAAGSVTWFKPWDRVCNDDRPPFTRWFEGGVLNTCYNALDRHVENGKGKQFALIYDSPVTSTVRKYSYQELLDLTARCAGGLVRLGVKKGDRVLIYMPMVPEAVISMLACARIGAIHSVVFGGFAPKELATRIEDAKPVCIITSSCGIEVSRIIPYKPLLDTAIDMCTLRPPHCIIVQRPQCPSEPVPGRDHDWEEVLGGESAPCVPVCATDPLYILYTSGTTGKPKGVLRDNGGHLVALSWSMKHIYGMDPGEVYWAASDIGWVVGHSYIVYAPLVYGCTTVLYEGKSVGTPDPGAFWRVISEHGVSVLFCAPTAFRAIRREDPEALHLGTYDLSSFRTLFLAGERCDPDTLTWAEQHLKVPVIDHWWQTETGWAIGANCVGLGMFPVKPGSCTRPVPGYSVHVFDTEGRELPPGTTGNIVIQNPLPPCCLTTLWQNDEDFTRTYFSMYPGYYFTSDAGYIDSDGYLWVMGRTDDIINIAGHRLSTGAMEEVLASHEDVAECAVTGVHDPVKGEVPVGFIVLKTGRNRTGAEIERELVRMMRERIGPIASFKVTIVVRRLPKTRSGKTLRGMLKKMASGLEFQVPATIEDPAVIEEIRLVLTERGFPKQ